jgi:hypothetical protein
MEDRTMSLDKVLYNFARRGVMPAMQKGVAGGYPMIANDGRFIASQPGRHYFAAGNHGVDGGTGDSWEKAFKTLEYAFDYINAISNKYTWAGRNVLHISGDDFVETLAALPEKTDIVGEGSSDNYSLACVRGNHAPVDSKMGCRWFNVRFRPAASADLWTLASTTGGGLEFHQCLFDATYSTFTAASGIDSTACEYWKVIDCDFIGAFSADFIDIGAGYATQSEIAYNRMRGGAANGLMTTAAVTLREAGRRGLIHDNFIQCVGITLDTQATSVFDVYNNQLISATAVGAGSYVIDLTFASNNYLTGDDVSVVIPDISTN